MSIKEEIKQIIAKSLDSLNIEYNSDEIIIDTPKLENNGDYSTNIALILTKKLKKPPLEIANLIKENINSNIFAKVEIASPGFINIYLKKERLYQEINKILTEGKNYGKNNLGNKSPIKHALINILKNPIIIGIFLGLVASFFNISFPKMIDKTINNLAVIASPLALISIGATFEGKKALAKIKPTISASFIKLVALAGIFLPIAANFGFRDQKLIAIVIMLASPCTPTSYIMAKNMDGDDTLAASIVVSTTLFSSITLTGWIFLMKSLSLIQ